MTTKKTESQDDFKSVLNLDRNWSSALVPPPPEALPNVENVTALVENVEAVLKQGVESNVDVTPDWARPNLEVRFHIVMNGRKQKEHVGPVIMGLQLGLIESVMKQLSHLTLNQIHHYAILGANLNDIYRAKKLVDVIIRVEDEIFTAARMCLSCHSELFTNIFLNNLVPAYAITDITLKDVDKVMFKRFMHFVYFGEVQIDEDTVEPLLKVADILESPTLRAKIILFANIKSEVNWQQAILILKKSPSALDRLTAIQAIVKDFRSLLEHPEFFKLIQLESMQDIISSDDLYVLTELDVFWAVLFWTIIDKEKRMGHLDTLIENVRFTCMSTLELLDCARANNMVSVSTTCRQLLVKAHWISHAKELGLDDPLLLQRDKPRNVLIDQAPHVPTVMEFDTRYLAFKYLSKISFGMKPQAKSHKASAKVKKRKKKKEKKPKEQHKDEKENELEIEEEVKSEFKFKEDDEKKPGLDDKSEEKEGVKPQPSIRARASVKTHEIKGGQWKRKRQRAASRIDVSAALLSLDLEDDKTPATETDTSGDSSGEVPSPQPQSEPGVNDTASDSSTAPPSDSEEIPSEEGKEHKDDSSPDHSSDQPASGVSSPEASPTDSPVNNPETDSPVNNPETDSPVNNPETDSPVNNPETDSPVNNPETDSPVNNPEEGSPDVGQENKTTEPKTDDESNSGNTSQNYRNLRTSASITIDNLVGWDQPFIPSLLDEPDGDMTRHLYPILQPIRSQTVHKRLSRKRDGDE